MAHLLRLGRREFLAGAVATGIASGLVGHAFASFDAAVTDDGSLTSGVWNDCRAVYTDGGALESATDSVVTTYGVGGIDVVGPAETGFSGSEYHLPVVDGNNNLELVAADGSVTGFGVAGSKAPRGSKSILTTAAWNGHPLSVYYPGGSASTLYRVDPGGSATQVAQPGNGIKAALGEGDLDADGTDEFAFVDGSATVRYIDPSDDSTSRSIESTGVSPGSNNNFGAGSPTSVDGYGVVIPAVNGSGGLGLLDTGGWAEKSLTSGSTAKKCSVHACDFDGDGDAEILFAGNSSGTLKYLDDVGGTNDVVSVTDASDDPIPVDSERGVR